jgi:cytochrome o ubiquinol oxidase subunit I
MFSNLDIQQLIFGRLSLEAIPYHEPILVATFAAVALGGVALLGTVAW